MEFDCLGGYVTLRRTVVACMTFQQLVQKSPSESSDSMSSVVCVYTVVCALIGQLKHGTICQLSWDVIGCEER